MATKVKLIADNAITTSQIDTSSLDSHFSGGTGVTYSSGEISIGQAVHSTDSPTFADLTLTGNLNITGDLNSYNVTDLDVTDQTITLGAGQTEALSGGSGIIVDGSNASILWDETNDVFDFNKGLTALGNVGIGIDNPETRLHISGSDPSIRLQAGSSADARVDFEDSGGTVRWYTGYDVSSGNIVLAADASGFNSSVTVQMDSSGNVGIGESNPDAPLHITSNTPIISFDESDASQEYRIGSFGGAFALYDSTDSAYRLTVDGSGRVGIGITDPIAPLTINNYLASATTGTDIFVKNPNVEYTNGDPHIYNAGPDGIIVTSNTSRTDGPDKMGLVLYNDDATAGGFSPMVLFAKRETGSTPFRAAMAAIYAKSPLGTGNNDAWIDGQLHFGTAGAGTEGVKSRLIIDSSGNVGIGTSPSHRLHVSSGTNTTVAQFASALGGAGNTAVVKITASGNSSNGLRFIQCGSSSLVEGGANAATVENTENAPLIFGTNSTEAMRIDSSGRVGIGSISPTVALEVHDDVSSGVCLELKNSNVQGYSGIHFRNNSDTLTGHVGYGNPSATNSQLQDVVYFGSITSDDVVFTTSDAEKMRIDSSGNVGIGNNLPRANLDVKRDTNTVNNLDSLGFDVAALIGNAGSNPGNHYSSGLRIYQGSGTVGSGLGVMHLGADNGTATTANRYTAQIIAPSGMTGGIKLSAVDSAGTIKFRTGGNNERMTIHSNGNVEVAEELILDSVGQSEWGMVKLDSQQLSGTYSQVEISISPSYSGYSVYKMIINRFRLAADGELWCNYMYGSTKKGGWYGGYSRAGEGNSTGQEGYSNQSQCEIVGTNTTATLGNSYPFVGEFTFYPLEAGNRGKIVWRGIGRLSSGLTQSIFGAALTTNTNAPDKIVFYSNQNISNFDYVLYGIKV